MRIKTILFTQFLAVQARAQITLRNTTFPVAGDTPRFHTAPNLDPGTVSAGTFPVLREKRTA